MAEQSTQSIEIDADPAEIMEVIADFMRTIRLGPGRHEAAAEVSAAPVTAAPTGSRSCSTPASSDRYELDYVWRGDRRVEWELDRGGAEGGARTVLTPSPAGGGTLRDLHLAVDLGIPMLADAQAQGGAGDHGHRAQGTRRGASRRGRARSVAEENNQN